MKSYLLKGIDPDTWSLLKAACAYNHTTLKEFFHESVLLAVGEFARTDFYKDIVKAHSEKEDD